MTSFRRYAVITSGLAVLLLAGCRVGPKYQKPPAMAQAPPPSYKESPTQFPEVDGWKVAQPQDAMLHGKWWEIYHEPELNALEDKLNIDNQNIRQSFENFIASRTLVAQARSQLFPTVSFGPSYSHSESSANTSSNTSGTVVATNRQSDLTSLPFSASWEPDIFGRIRNQISQAQFNAQVSAADLENERLIEQAALAVYYFQIRGQDALQAILDQTVASDQKALDYNKTQYEFGITQQISVVEAENTLENAKSVALNLGVARAQYQHAIATLIGENASTFSIPVRALEPNPPAVPIGVPSQLLERRPDIAATERNMAAANAAIGVADAAFFPALTISASAGVQGSSLTNLFNWSSRFWSVGPGVSQSIYDGGLRRAAVRQYTAVYNADVAQYRQTVLTAFQQVEDYLASVRILSQQIQQQQLAAQSAQQFVDLETVRFQMGLDPYINVVTAQTTLLSDQQTLTNLHTQAMTASVQLIEALGGGWDATQLPTPKQVSAKLTPAETAIQR